jgi:O-antigen/teichoic acid export membrane protein
VFEPTAIPSRSLASRATTAFSWNVTGAFVRAGAGLMINAMLAHLLGPEPFGRLALAMVVITLGNLLVESGMGAGLIQKPELEELDIRYAFTAQMAAGLGLTAIVAVFAPLAAVALGQREVAPVLRVLSAMLAIQAFGQTGLALLRRNLDFKKIQTLQIASYIVGYLAVGIPLALLGHGVWSLVAAQLTQSGILSGGAWLLTGHSIRPHRSRARRSLAAFGVKVAVTNIVCWAVGAVPSLLIGRFQGMEALGFYSRAYFLVGAPASVLSSSFQSTSFSVYSRLQKHLRLTARTYLGLTSLCQMLTVPVFLAVAAMPRAIIETLFGHRWLAAAGVLTPLALAMPLDCLAALASPLLIARGRPGLEFRVQVITALSTLAVVGFLSTRASTQTTAWGVLFGVYLIRMTAATQASIHLVRLPWSRWAKTVAASTLLGALCFVTVSTLEGRLTAQGVPAWTRLLLLAALTGAASLTALYFSPNRILRREALQLLIGGILPRPSRAHSWARFAVSRGMGAAQILQKLPQ